jgi:hypothetical protein
VSSASGSDPSGDLEVVRALTLRRLIRYDVGMRKIKHIIMSILALTALAVPVAVASEVATDSAPAASAISNCAVGTYSIIHHGVSGGFSLCRSTAGSGTQHRVRIVCKLSGSPDWATVGPWKNVNQDSSAYCPSGWTLRSTPTYQIR